MRLITQDSIFPGTPYYRWEPLTREDGHLFSFQSKEVIPEFDVDLLCLEGGSIFVQKVTALIPTREFLQSIWDSIPVSDRRPAASPVEGIEKWLNYDSLVNHPFFPGEIVLGTKAHPDHLIIRKGTRPKNIKRKIDTFLAIFRQHCENSIEREQALLMQKVDFLFTRACDLRNYDLMNLVQSWVDRRAWRDESPQIREKEEELKKLRTEFDRAYLSVILEQDIAKEIKDVLRKVIK